MRGNRDNLLSLYAKSKDWERTEGRIYYGRQRDRLWQRSSDARQPLWRVVAAFCALSPNNAESTNYRALDTCLEIVAGRLPESAKVIAYTPNKIKALALLRRAPLSTLSGRKVTAFYHSTLNPNSSKYVCIDGHMLGAWAGQRFILRRNAEIHGSKEYKAIANDFRSAAECVQLPAPQFQAILWLTWKRVHDILYQPQLSFPLDEFQMGTIRAHSPASPPSSLLEVGRLKNIAAINTGSDTSGIRAEQLSLALNEVPVAIVKSSNICLAAR